MPELTKEDREELKRIIDLPKKERLKMGLSNNADILKKFDISEPTFYRIKNGGNGDNADLTQEGLEGLRRGAKRGSPAASKTLLEYTGEFKRDKGEDDIHEYTHAEVARDAETIIEYFRERLGETGVCPVCQKPHLLSDEIRNN